MWFFFSSRRRHTSWTGDWSSDVCSSDLDAALKEAITIKGGAVEQSNFHDFELLRIDEMPVVEVHVIPSTEPPSGTGEPGLPATAPAVANAIFAVTGKRLRTLPFKV